LIVLVDSWAWIEYLKGSPAGEKAKEIIESSNRLLLATINVSEIYRFLLENMPGSAEKLMQFVLKSSFVIPLETQTALKSARIKHEKRMGLADAIVLATAIENKASVLTGDDDFKKIPNIIYIGK